MNKNLDVLEKKLFIFDLDGTLVDSPYWIVLYANITRLAFGFNGLVPCELEKLVGSPPKAFWNLSHPVPEKISNAMTMDFRRRLINHPFDARDLYESVAELLDYLKSQRKRLSIATNKPTVNAKHVLMQCGIQDYFSEIVGSDSFDAKPSPAMLSHLCQSAKVDSREAVMIGDRQEDIEASHWAGMSSIGIGQSFGPKDSLNIITPSWHFDSISSMFKSISSGRG